MPSITDYFGSKRRRLNSSEKTTTTTTSLVQPKSATPTITTDVTQTPADDNISHKKCTIDCCDLSSPTAARFKFEKEKTVRVVQGKKRFFQEDWLKKHQWLVLCKTENSAYCQLCRYAINSKIVQCAANGIETFTSKGFTNWRKDNFLWNKSVKQI